MGAMTYPPIRPFEEFIEKEWRPYCEPALDGVVFDGDAPPGPVPMLVQRLIPRAGITFLGGQSGAGKSFVAIDLAVAVATGEAFFGHEVIEAGCVIYVAAEGAASIATRLAAAKKARGIDEKLPVATVTAIGNLSDAKVRREFIRKLEAVAKTLRDRHGVDVKLIIVDTIAAAFSMKDENAAGEVNAVCKAAAELGDAIGAAVLAVAHYGKDASTGLRGSSASRAAGESVLAVLAERDETTGRSGNRRLVHAKSRVGEEGPIAAFELRDVTIATGDDGEPLTAGYVAVTTSDAAGQPAKRPRSELDITMREFGNAYARLADSVAESAGLDGAPVRKVRADAIRDEMKSRGFLEASEEGPLTSTGRSNFRRAKGQLLSSGKFVEKDSLIWKI